MRAALDTNVLAYAEGVDEPERQADALIVIGSIPGDNLAIAAQALGELFTVLTRKLRMAPRDARSRVLTWQDAYPVLATTETVLRRAVDLAVQHQFAIWDAIILAAASEAGCRVLLSEDMQDGFTWGGVTIVNPFASPAHRLLDDLRR